MHSETYELGGYHEKYHCKLSSNGTHWEINVKETEMLATLKGKIKMDQCKLPLSTLKEELAKINEDNIHIGKFDFVEEEKDLYLQMVVKVWINRKPTPTKIEKELIRLNDERLRNTKHMLETIEEI